MARAIPSLSDCIEVGWKLGAEEGFSGVVKAFNLANGAFTLLFVLIILAVTALVGGEFIEAIPTDGPFENALTDIEENSATAFVVFAVGLLIIPAVAIIGYLWVNMGGMMGTMNGRRLQR